MFRFQKQGVASYVITGEIEISFNVAVYCEDYIGGE